jgi:hypothetical protein
VSRANFGSYYQYIVAEVEIDREQVLGTGGPAYPRLILPSRVFLNPVKDVNLIFSDLHAELFTNSDHAKIADSVNHPFHELMLCNYEHRREPYLNIEFPLDAIRIEKIENARKANVSLLCKMHLGLVAHHPKFDRANPRTSGFLEAPPLYADLQLDITQSVWVERVLPGLGYGVVKLVELPMVSARSYSALGGSYQALDNAQECFKLGLYNEAAGACRIALEPLSELVDKPDGQGKMPKLRKSWETMLGAATHTWLDQCLNAVRWAANPVHHSPTDRFDRFEAQMLIAITTTVISYAARCAALDQSGEEKQSS